MGEYTITNSKIKEYHWYNYDPSNSTIDQPYGITISPLMTFKDTRDAISKGVNIIYTYQSCFITADLIKSGYVIILHPAKNIIPIKIDKNSKIGSEKIGTMKSNKSVEHWILHDILGLY